MSVNRSREHSTQQAPDELLGALNQVFYSVLLIDPDTATLKVLQSIDRPDTVAQWLPLVPYLESYRHLLTPHAREQVMAKLAPDALRAICRSGSDGFSITVPYRKPGQPLNWLTISTQICPRDDGGWHVYLFARKGNSAHLRQSIVDLYVDHACDYFVCLDATTYTYTMLSCKQEGTPLPPVEADDRDAALLAYKKQYIAPEDLDKVLRETSLPHVLAELEKNGVHTFNCGFRDPQRGYTRKQLTYRYYDKESQMILLSRADITDIYLEQQTQRQALQQATREAQQDMLTGLLNYKGIIQHVQQALAEDHGPAALLFIDVDDFKSVNDTLGHQEGDRTLRRVACALEQQTRAHDLRGRIGGDEFVVYLRHLKEPGQAEICARRICDTIRQIEFFDDESLHLTCSIGVALVPRDGSDYKSLFKIADACAYYVKAHGKDDYHIHQAGNIISIKDKRCASGA